MGLRATFNLNLAPQHRQTGTLKILDVDQSLDLKVNLVQQSQQLKARPFFESELHSN